MRDVLRRTQRETEALEHDVRQQQEVIEGLAAAEAGLRRKLDRARGERAAYRLSAEKLGRDVKELKANATSADRTPPHEVREEREGRRARGRGGPGQEAREGDLRAGDADGVDAEEVGARGGLEGRRGFCEAVPAASARGCGGLVCSFPLFYFSYHYLAPQEEY